MRLEIFSDYVKIFGVAIQKCVLLLLLLSARIFASVPIPTIDEGAEGGSVSKKARIDLSPSPLPPLCVPSLPSFFVPIDKDGALKDVTQNGASICNAPGGTACLLPSSALPTCSAGATFSVPAYRDHVGERMRAFSMACGDSQRTLVADRWPSDIADNDQMTLLSDVFLGSAATFGEDDQLGEGNWSEDTSVVDEQVGPETPGIVCFWEYEKDKDYKFEGAYMDEEFAKVRFYVNCWDLGSYGVLCKTFPFLWCSRKKKKLLQDWRVNYDKDLFWTLQVYQYGAQLQFIYVAENVRKKSYLLVDAFGRLVYRWGTHAPDVIIGGVCGIYYDTSKRQFFVKKDVTDELFSIKIHLMDDCLQLLCTAAQLAPIATFPKEKGKACQYNPIDFLKSVMPNIEGYEQPDIQLINKIGCVTAVYRSKREGESIQISYRKNKHQHLQRYYGGAYSYGFSCMPGGGMLESPQLSLRIKALDEIVKSSLVFQNMASQRVMEYMFYGVRGVDRFSALLYTGDRVDFILSVGTYFLRVRGGSWMGSSVDCELITNIFYDKAMPLLTRGVYQLTPSVFYKTRCAFGSVDYPAVEDLYMPKTCALHYTRRGLLHYTDRLSYHESGRNLFQWERVSEPRAVVHFKACLSHAISILPNSLEYQYSVEMLRRDSHRRYLLIQMVEDRFLQKEPFPKDAHVVTTHVKPPMTWGYSVSHEDFIRNGLCKCILYLNEHPYFLINLLYQAPYADESCEYMGSVGWELQLYGEAPLPHITIFREKFEIKRDLVQSDGISSRQTVLVQYNDGLR